MTHLIQAVLLFFSQVFFSVALAPLFLFPRFAQARWTRRAIASAFGKRLSHRYHKIIAFYGTSYGAALRYALGQAARVGNEVQRAVDCGTGTGFAAAEIHAQFPEATVLCLDRVLEMLRLAGQRFEHAERWPPMVLADSFHTPLEKGTLDLVVSQNSVPFLHEFARLCRPGGCVVFVDTAARWVHPLARRAAKKTGLFDLVIAERAGIGFYLLARRAASSDQ